MTENVLSTLVVAAGNVNANVINKYIFCVPKKNSGSICLLWSQGGSVHGQFPSWLGTLPDRISGGFPKELCRLVSEIT